MARVARADDSDGLLSATGLMMLSSVRADHEDGKGLPPRSFRSAPAGAGANPFTGYPRRRRGRVPGEANHDGME